VPRGRSIWDHTAPLRVAATATRCDDHGVAILGVLALIGILIRNSLILVVQIEELRAEGKLAGPL
jgi:multidrug efflux pump subunit AcrB